MAFISLPHPLTPGRDPSSPPTQSPSPSSPPSPSDANTKYYTLIFLASIGTTLLITGFTGRKGMTKVRDLKLPVNGMEGKGKGKSVLRDAATTTTSTLPTPRARRTATNEFPPVPYSKPPKHLKHWYLLPSSSSPLPSSSSSAPQTPDFFAPNSSLLSSSLSFAESVDRADKLHEDGAPPKSESESKSESKEGQEEDDFNGAVHAMKALGIATLLVAITATGSIWGLKKWLEVDDLPTLALALRQTLSPTIQSNRPTLPAWSIPSSSSSSSSSSSDDNDNKDESPLLSSARTRISRARVGSGAEEEAEDEEVMSYWTELKLALDEEAKEEERERERRWREVRGLPEVVEERSLRRVELGDEVEVEEGDGKEEGRGWWDWLRGGGGMRWWR